MLENVKKLLYNYEASFLPIVHNMEFFDFKNWSWPKTVCEVIYISKLWGDEKIEWTLQKLEYWLTRFQKKNDATLLTYLYSGLNY